MKRWGDIALANAQDNPDVTVVADAVTPVTPAMHRASEHEEQVALVVLELVQVFRREIV